jgi:hypothetical protein
MLLRCEGPKPPMSQLGQQRKAHSHQVCFASVTGHCQGVSACRVRARSGSEHTQQTQRSYSITSSARASTVAGMSRPSAFAVLRLTTSSYLVGACTGRSAGFSPLRI